MQIRRVHAVAATVVVDDYYLSHVDGIVPFDATIKQKHEFDVGIQPIWAVSTAVRRSYPELLQIKRSESIIASITRTHEIDKEL